MEIKDHLKIGINKWWIRKIKMQLENVDKKPT